MGGQPIAAFLSLAVPARLRESWLEGFISGFVSLARAQRITLAGGDTAESPSRILADVVVLGTVPRGKAVLRSTARPGDDIYVTGQLGASAAALNELLSGRKRKLSPPSYPHHFFPLPRVEIGRFLRERNIASAMIDLSDGPSTDLTHLCEESAVGAEITASSLPLATLGKSRQRVDLGFALNGGDDYELLFTAGPRKLVPASIAGTRITRIGAITKSKEIVVLDDTGQRSALEPRGWEHFRRKK
jgi:thiamine-monophosphate kinase